MLHLLLPLRLLLPLELLHEGRHIRGHCIVLLHRGRQLLLQPLLLRGVRRLHVTRESMMANTERDMMRQGQLPLLQPLLLGGRLWRLSDQLIENTNIYTTERARCCPTAAADTEPDCDQLQTRGIWIMRNSYKHHE